MAGKAKAVASGNELRDRVASLGKELGLEAEIEVKVGRRVWGAKRRIDVVLRHAETRRSLGVECKYQFICTSESDACSDGDCEK